MGAIRNDEGGVARVSRIHYDSVAAPKGFVRIACASEMTDIRACMVILGEMVKPLTSLFISIRVGWIRSGFRRLELGRINVAWDLFRIVQLQYLSSTQTRFNNLVAVRIGKKQKLFASLITEGETVATRI